MSLARLLRVERLCCWCKKHNVLFSYAFDRSFLMGMLEASGATEMGSAEVQLVEGLPLSAINSLSG